MATPEELALARRLAAEELIRSQNAARELARVHRIRQEDAARIRLAEEAYDRATRDAGKQ